MQVVYAQNFTIRSSEVDTFALAHPHALIQIMQETSMQHTLVNQISFQDLAEIQASWILLKMEVDFKTLPNLNAEVSVETFPSAIQGFLPIGIII